MKVGDLIKIQACPSQREDCECWFCRSCSNRVGWIAGYGPDNTYITHFDCGYRLLRDRDFSSGRAKIMDSETGHHSK